MSLHHSALPPLRLITTLLPLVSRVSVPSTLLPTSLGAMGLLGDTEETPGIVFGLREAPSTISNSKTAPPATDSDEEEGQFSDDQEDLQNTSSHINDTSYS